MSEIKVLFSQSPKWWDLPYWTLLEDYNGLCGIVVPKGFITDGASIPFGFRWLFSSTGRYFGAAIVHDYLLKEGQTWLISNNKFEEELELLGISPWRKHLMVGGVKLWSIVKR